MTFQEIYEQYKKDNIAFVAEPPAYLFEKRQGEYSVEDLMGIPEGMFLELIDGVLYYTGAPTTRHQRMSIQLIWEVLSYIKSKNGDCHPYHAPTSVLLGEKNSDLFQPDFFVLCDKNKDKGTYIEGAPDFIVEILSPSTKKRDVGIKLAKYRAAGVREYWMIDIDNRTITVCEFGAEEKTAIYSLDSSVPVGIFNGELELDFRKIMKSVD